MRFKLQPPELTCGGSKFSINAEMHQLVAPCGYDGGGLSKFIDRIGYAVVSIRPSLAEHEV